MTNPNPRNELMAFVGQVAEVAPGLKGPAVTAYLRRFTPNPDRFNADYAAHQAGIDDYWSHVQFERLLAGSPGNTVQTAVLAFGVGVGVTLLVTKILGD